MGRWSSMNGMLGMACPIVQVVNIKASVSGSGEAYLDCQYQSII